MVISIAINIVLLRNGFDKLRRFLLDFIPLLHHATVIILYGNTKHRT